MVQDSGEQGLLKKDQKRKRDAIVCEYSEDFVYMNRWKGSRHRW